MDVPLSIVRNNIESSEGGDNNRIIGGIHVFINRLIACPCQCRVTTQESREGINVINRKYLERTHVTHEDETLQ